jgi:hypothetical protein
MNISNIETNNNINENNNIIKKKRIYKKKELTPEQQIERDKKIKEKKALFALKYYRKRVESDPAYKQLLNERSKKNTNLRKGNDPDKPPSVGRPRTHKYDLNI